MVEAQWLMHIAQRRIEALDESQMRLASVVRSIDESTKNRLRGTPCDVENERGDTQNSADRCECDKENRAGPVLAVLPQKPRGKRHSVTDKAQATVTPERGAKKQAGTAQAVDAKPLQVRTHSKCGSNRPLFQNHLESKIRRLLFESLPRSASPASAPTKGYCSRISPTIDRQIQRTR